MHMHVYVPPRTPPNLGIVYEHQLFKTKRGKSYGGEYWADDLHNLAGSSRPHLYGLGQMGAWTDVLTQAASAFTGGGTKPAPNGGPAPGGPTTGIQQPGTVTAISPTIQTEISPQISPVFSQMQDSPYAVQAATTTQYQPGGMYAEGGSAYGIAPPLPAAPVPSLPVPSPSYFSGPTKGGGLPYTPLDPSSLTNLPTAGGMIRDIQESQPFNWTPVYWIGGIAVVGAVALTFMRKRK